VRRSTPSISPLPA
jgi:hypothetical protein